MEILQRHKQHALPVEFKLMLHKEENRQVAVFTVQDTMHQDVTDGGKCLNNKMPKSVAVIVRSESDIHNSHHVAPQHAVKADCHANAGPSHLKLLTNELFGHEFLYF